MAREGDTGNADTEHGSRARASLGLQLGEGDVVGQRWRLETFLDSGGMGEVWRATDLRLDEEVAIKLMDPHLVDTDHARQRFLREARSAAQLRGSNVVAILDFDVDRRTNVPYMVMELLRGENLGRRLSRGPLGFLQMLSVVADICNAVRRAHRRGIVHRDLKPSNVFLAREDEELVTKLLDFGIAKLARESARLPGDMVTTTGHALGTLSYMSPEQIETPRDVDARSDLWSIGVLVFECLLGRNPFVGATAAQTVYRICFDPLPVPSHYGDVPPGFDAWFSTAVAREPARRFQSARELLEVLRSLGSAGPRAMAEQSGSRMSLGEGEGTSPSWASDANQIDIRVLKDLTFVNSVVDEFLEEGSKHFVAGAKGLGKTLLLTYKRSLLSERYHGSAGGAPSKAAAAVQLVPEGRPYLDLMGDLRTPSKAHVDFMGTLGNCKRAWGFALRVSAISHHAALVTEDDAEDLAPWPRRLRAMIEGQRAEPTLVVKELLSLSVGQINRLVDESEGFLEHKIRSLHSGMFFFIDKVDQALRRLSRQAWVHMQAGLIEAAWDLMNTNRHIKVFATIREEAFSSYESDIKTNLYGATTTLRYSRRDLRDMLEKLTHFYEGLPLRDFVSPEVLGGRGNEDEDAFDFVYRHTLGRPRDLVIIASEISRNRSSLDERVFKRVVQETSANIVVGNVFDEMRVFLDVLRDKGQRTRLLSLLPHGVLTPDETIAVWCRLHGVEREYYDTYGHDSPDVYHPFRELYDCGVLGIVEREEGRSVQRFRQPHDAIDGLQHVLPRSSVYLLHPALQALVLRLAQGDGHRVFRHIVVGHEQPWPPHYDTILDVQRAIFRVSDAQGDDREAEELVMDLLGEFDRRVVAGQDPAAVRLAVGASTRMRQVLAHLEARGWDEIYLTLLDRFPGSG